MQTFIVGCAKHERS